MSLILEDKKLIFVGGKGGVGKCCKGNTLMLTTRGIIKIEDIVHEQIDFSNRYIDHGQTNFYDNLYDNDDYNINEILREEDNNIKNVNNIISISSRLNYEKYKIIDRYDMGESDIITIKTRIGLEISGTPEHKVVIIDNNGKLRFKMLQDMSTTDHIAASYNTNIFNEKLKLNFFYRRNRHDNQSQILKNINYMNPDIAELLGYIISEGNDDRTTIVITNYDREIIDRISNICKYINIEAQEKYIDEKLVGTAINSIAFKEFAYYLGFRKLAQNKEVPWSILQADKDSQISFIRALFDGDGTVGLGQYDDHPLVEYNSSSYELCRQLQIILLNFGIIGRLHSKKGAINEYRGEIREYEESYRLIIMGGEILKFAEIINFGLSRKKEILNKCVEILESKDRWTDITYPNIGKVLNRLYEELKILGQKGKIIKEWQEDFIIDNKKVKLTRKKAISCKNYLKNDQQLIYWYIKEGKPSIYGLRNLLSIMRPVSYLSEYKYLELLSDQFIFDNVVTIKNEKARVYDVTIEGVHSYIGNSIINHNTTISSAIALHLSEIARQRGLGDKILLFSTDPAHSISDSFNIKIGEIPTPVTNTLDAVEINIDQLMNEFKGRHKGAIQELLTKAASLDKKDADHALELAIPGIDEFMSLIKLSSFLEQNMYKTIVVDTAPTGHTLRLLSMPNAVNSWLIFFSGLHNRYKGMMRLLTGINTNDVENFISTLTEGIYKTHMLITDKEKTEFIVATIPDLMAIEETKRLFINLYSAGIKVNNIVINNIQTSSDCPFCQSRRNYQNKYIDMINTSYASINKIYVPLFSTDISGIDYLKSFENMLFN
jgi:arsenite-transporting ATPase